jgi:gamma-glutamyltranspeptidase/glutathione hydrolase
MTQSFLGRRGIAVAPHNLASESALRVLREGGNALEAMIAAAASIAVVYPHMNSIGGDGFWVVGGASGPRPRPRWRVMPSAACAAAFRSAAASLR